MKTPWYEYMKLLAPGNELLPRPNIRELIQLWWRRLQKRHLKSKFALLQTLSRLFQLVLFVICWKLFVLELNSKGLYYSPGTEKKSCCLVFPSSTKREIRKFHVAVVQPRVRNVQKLKSVMHVQSCWFANLNLLFLCRSRWRRRRLCLNSLFYVRRSLKKSIPVNTE